MMWLQHCQLKLIKIHVVLYDIVIKITQFPNGVQVFAGLELEGFHGFKLCSCSVPRDLKPWPLAVIAQKPSNGACYASTLYLKLLKNSHMGQTQRAYSAVKGVRQAYVKRLVSREMGANRDTLLRDLYMCALIYLFLSSNTLLF